MCDQTQTRSCQDGTTDKCNNVEIERTITCSAAGTAYPVCEKLPGKTYINFYLHHTLLFFIQNRKRIHN